MYEGSDQEIYYAFHVMEFRMATGAAGVLKLN
jgi:hypothetical protein